MVLTHTEVDETKPVTTLADRNWTYMGGFEVAMQAKANTACPSCREWPKVNYPGRSEAQIQMLSLRKYAHGLSESLPTLKSKTAKPRSEQQGVFLMRSNAFKESLSAIGGNYWLWEPWVHYWEITYGLSKASPVQRWKLQLIVFNPSAFQTHLLTSRSTFSIIISFQIKFF